jgi:tubulin--tyrosine ligase-like protein 12
LICIVARRVKEGQGVNEETMITEPIWLPTTFNLKTELAQFIAFYLAKKAKYYIKHITDTIEFSCHLHILFLPED